MELIFATHNNNKVKEVTKMLPSYLSMKSLTDINFFDEIEETGTTFEENAQLKAKTIFDKTGKNIFADDSGLVIEALDGAPGVYSARYAGTGKDEDNIAKALKELEGKTNRKAYFISIFCLILDGKEYFFEGRVNGTIATEIMGDNGFGYDPIFIPDGFSKSFAQMSPEEKNAISHRGKAVEKLNDFLTNLNVN
ncbi:MULTISPECIES: RdgB/HAM1 family non-canonical purine NTP pyrophosphatase [Empedobacter]|uniref:dITP/XTP pyrophosphatase n=1 Tax=Empedobacter falsenii TaxID=343874 RepID=A0A3R8SP18_9FLAO|nr:MULTISPECIES: RdgB/HAM1 family non-canonical purine NTP pyrophosphatase [Empedobacter]MDH1601615.1 RdgB/HAM1 family non-canonical purine NTP pyrophosphatase [Empedobacter sp. GD03739]MDH2205864.1 RdgB/HAM1 family non-canonical purine NTP pyrophosphatase [Empedobacter sp. GD03644]MDM1041286.1 RdgB/HAM1 family non-canonical purine NTP pyrophosphatase [Empedobacter brevis]MDM1134650.1 RdgB/HAM1 family non-canonical purine NTP pyrophosphatase [Empedobacter sp. R750]MDM1546738.1 RdgB/HAM1 family